MEDAAAEEESLEVVRRHDECFANTLVAEQRYAAISEQSSGAGQRLDRIRHVVEWLGDMDELVVAGGLEHGGIGDAEDVAVLETAVLEVTTGRLDGRLVGVDPVHVRLRVCPAMAGLGRPRRRRHRPLWPAVPHAGGRRLGHPGTRSMPAGSNIGRVNAA